MADRLTHSKRNIKRLKQRRVAEWLEQALHRTLFEHSRAHTLISLSGDEDDWNLLPTNLQFLLKAGTCHSVYNNVLVAQTHFPCDAFAPTSAFPERCCSFAKFAEDPSCF
jgi:hypothetical protein